MLTFFGKVCKCKAPTETGDKLFRHGCADIFSRPTAQTQARSSSSNAGNLAFLTAIESEGKPIVSLRAASPKSEKHLLALGDRLAMLPSTGRGVLLASATETGSERFIAPGRRRQSSEAPYLASKVSKRLESGPGARASMEEIVGSLAEDGSVMAAAGSASQLASQDGGGCDSR